MSKVQGEVSNDGWNYVGSRKGKKYPRPSTLGLPAQSTDLTLAKMTADIGTKIKLWQASDCRKQLVQILARLRPDAGWDLSKAMILGSGSFSRDNLECRKRSTWQMVLFLDVTKILQAGADENIRLYAQDPAYTEIDRQFLQSLGVQMLYLNYCDLPAIQGLGPAKEFCDSTTFVFEACMDMDSQILRDFVQADLKLYLGTIHNKINNWKLSLRDDFDQRRKHAHTVDDLRRRKTMQFQEQAEVANEFVKGRRMYFVPVFEPDPNILEGLAVFGKEEAEDNGDSAR